MQETAIRKVEADNEIAPLLRQSTHHVFRHQRQKVFIEQQFFGLQLLTYSREEQTIPDVVLHFVSGI